jgi:hypothetical protein
VEARSCRPTQITAPSSQTPDNSAKAPAGARLLAFELVTPDGAEPHIAKMVDLTMLGMLTGSERTRPNTGSC